jgi:hypothetical protein
MSFRALSAPCCGSGIAGAVARERNTERTATTARTLGVLGRNLASRIVKEDKIRATFRGYKGQMNCRIKLISVTEFGSQNSSS